MSCSGIMQRYTAHNCHTCRYYVEKENICTHPELGNILTLFLDTEGSCPFWEGWDEYREHGEGD